MKQTNRWVPSRFNAISHTKSGELVLYNSYTGAIAAVSPGEKPEVLAALSRQAAKGELSETLKMMLPGGSVCYAAKPHSLAVGADGKLYKCTCALDEEVNRIGRLLPDGSVAIDYDKLALWVGSGDDKDPVCRSCFYRPSCQGNHCPLYRMKTGLRPCPFEKRKIRKVLSLIWQNYTAAGR